MARSKQTKSATKKEEGKYRQETREERRARLQQQEEARQKCFNNLPYVGGAIFLFMIVFSIYVRSVPPKTIPKPIIQQVQSQGGIPEFTVVDPDPKPDIPPETATTTGETLSEPEAVESHEYTIDL